VPLTRRRETRGRTNVRVHNLICSDPIVHVYANALLTGTGTTGVVLADLRDPGAILSHPVTRDVIDFRQPVALMLIAIAHFITDDEHLGEAFIPADDIAPDGTLHVELAHAGGIPDPLVMTCACGLATGSRPEMDAHILGAFTPQGSVGLDGRKHVPVPPD
jgi:hypothetical protein